MKQKHLLILLILPIFCPDLVQGAPEFRGSKQPFREPIVLLSNENDYEPLDGSGTEGSGEYFGHGFQDDLEEPTIDQIVQPTNSEKDKMEKSSQDEKIIPMIEEVDGSGEEPLTAEVKNTEAAVETEVENESRTTEKVEIEEEKHVYLVKLTRVEYYEDGTIRRFENVTVPLSKVYEYRNRPLWPIKLEKGRITNAIKRAKQATFDLPGGEIRKTEDEDKETDNIEVEDEARKPKVQKAIRRIKYRYPLTAKIPKIPLAVAIASSTEEKGQTVTRKPHSFITAAVASAQRNPFVTAKLPITIIDQTETIIQPRNGHTITEGDLTSNTAAEEELTEPPTEITATLTTEGVAEEITEEITESNAEKAEKTAELTTATKLPFVTSEVTEIVTVTEAPTSTTTESFEPFKTVDLPQFFGARIDAAPISRTRAHRTSRLTSERPEVGDDETATLAENTSAAEFDSFKAQQNDTSISYGDFVLAVLKKQEEIKTTVNPYDAARLCTPKPCCSLDTSEIPVPAWDVPPNLPASSLAVPRGSDFYSDKTMLVVNLNHCYPLSIIDHRGGCTEVAYGGRYPFRCIRGFFRHGLFAGSSVVGIRCGACQ